MGGSGVRALGAVDNGRGRRADPGGASVAPRAGEGPIMAPVDRPRPGRLGVCRRAPPLVHRARARPEVAPAPPRVAAVARGAQPARDQVRPRGPARRAAAVASPPARAPAPVARRARDGPPVPDRDRGARRGPGTAARRPPARVPAVRLGRTVRPVGTRAAARGPRPRRADPGVPPLPRPVRAAAHRRAGVPTARPTGVTSGPTGARSAARAGAA